MLSIDRKKSLNFKKKKPNNCWLSQLPSSMGYTKEEIQNW